MSDIGGIKKFINSNVTGDPMNCLLYINSIESEGENSYILHEDNSNLWLDLIMNSLTVYKVKSIHSIIYNRLKTSDIDTLIETNGRLGKIFNLFYDTDTFQEGGIDTIITHLSTINIDVLEKKFYDGIMRYINSTYASENITTWISEKFSIPEIASYETIEAFSSVKEIVNKIYQNPDLIEFLKFTPSFIKPIVSSEELSEDLIRNNDALTIVESCDLWFHEFIENPISLGKLLAFKSGMNPSEYKDINAIIDKTSAINSVVGNEDALSYIEKSDLGTSKIITWKLGDNALPITSMNDLMSNDSMVTKIVSSNGTAKDVIPILKRSIPALKIAMKNNKVSDLMITTLGVDTDEVGYACIELYPDVNLFKTYSSLYEKVFSKKTLSDKISGKKEVLEWLMKNEAFLIKAISYEPFLTSFSASKVALYVLEGYEKVRKSILENDAFAKKIVGNDSSFSYITNRIGWANYIAYSYPMMNEIVSDYAKIKSIMDKSDWRSILLNSWMSLDIIMNSKNAIKALKENVNNSQSFLDLLISSETLMKYLTNMTSIFGSDTIVSELSSNNTLLKVITNSSSAMSSIIDSATGMVSVSDSQSAMHAIANSKVLVKAILASDTALNAILYSENAMTEIASSDLAMKIITSNELGMQKVAASSVAMNAVAASSVAMNAVAASSVAMNAVAASSVAMAAVIANTNALNTVAASSVARTALYNSASVVEPILAKSSTALNALRNSAQFATVNASSSSSDLVLFNGKAFVLNIRTDTSVNTKWIHGKYVVGNAEITESVVVPTNKSLNKFASSVTMRLPGYGTGIALYAEIFKI